MRLTDKDRKVLVQKTSLDRDRIIGGMLWFFFEHGIQSSLLARQAERCDEELAMFANPNWPDKPEQAMCTHGAHLYGMCHVK